VYTNSKEWGLLSLGRLRMGSISMDQRINDRGNDRLARLAKIYSEIEKWGRSQGDSQVALRKTEAINPNSKLFIIGESYAKDQVHLTGVNWFNKSGEIGRAGCKLEKILNCLGYTVKPPRPVKIENVWVNPCTEGRHTVYTTDICPCYPHDGKKIKDALNNGFLCQEIEIVQPKIILLLGKKSFRTFFKHVLKKDIPGSISHYFANLAPGAVGGLEKYMDAIVVPFYHPSPANGRFMSWWKVWNPRLLEAPQIRALQRIVSK
jgi:uracil-DNA glycosylase